MSRIIAPGICRYSINGTFGSRPVANIWDMDIDSAAPISREENIETGAERLLNAWCDHMLPLLCNDYTFVSVSWVDLDSEDGTTGEITSGEDETLPQNGSVLGDPLPSNVAAKVDKVIARTRGRRNGRMYVCGLPETTTTTGAPNIVAAATRTALDDALNAVLTAVDDVALDQQWNSQVVHTGREVETDPDSPIEFKGASSIVTFRTDSLLATQRRRLRG